MKKKLLSLLLVTTISLGIIGCGDKGKDNPTETINENFSGAKDYYLAVLPDNTTKVTHRGRGLGVVTIDGYSDAGIKIDDTAISSNYLNEEGIAEGSFIVYVNGYTEEEAEMYAHETNLESITSIYGDDEGVVEIYEDGDYIILIGETTMNGDEKGYYIRCFTKNEEGDPLGASVHIHCRNYDKETIRKYLAKLSYSMASEDDEEYIVEKILKYTNSKGWFTLTDATLVTDMREMTITYDGLEIESYKDLEVDKEWKNYTKNNGFTVYAYDKWGDNMFYFCKGDKCYFSVACKDDLEMDEAWNKIEKSILK